MSYTAAGHDFGATYNLSITTYIKVLLNRNTHKKRLYIDLLMKML